MRFLDALRTGRSVSAAARDAGMARRTVYGHRARDPEFAAAWDDAIEEGTDTLEDVALRRAVEGQSDTMLIFMLKARRPEKYRDRSHIINEQAGRVTFNVISPIPGPPNSGNGE